MILTQKQIDDLNKVANKLPLQRLIGYTKDGTITEEVLNQLTNMSNERRSQLLAIINGTQPDAAEQVVVSVAKEPDEWNELDKGSIDALANYFNKHPDTPHQYEIDNFMWTDIEYISDEQQKKNAAKLYLQLFPNGWYQHEAKMLVAPAVNDVPSSPFKVDTPSPAVNHSPTPPYTPPSTSHSAPSSIDNMDLVEIWDWIAANHNNTNYDMARQHFVELKQKELATMQEQVSAYPPDRVFYLLEKGIFNEGELIQAGLATPESLQILRKRDDILETLPDINVEIAKCREECADDHTDIYLFGIPSTGKTCILMGLIGSPNININTVRAGGPYACVLEQFLDAGLTIGQTPKDFVATIEASIQDGRDKHLINLVEMAGEDFAFKIADNENGTVSLEDIGVGATKLLCNGNKKSFFIIIDPTAKRVAFNHLVNETDAEGNIRTYLVRKNVNQKIIIKRLVDLLAQPENKRILQNVSSISIVITKADLLGNGQERETEAYQRFMDQHKNIIGPLIDLCRENGINTSTNGQPMLYTFSLGHFYVGGVYQYDPTDANKLIEVLKGNTQINK